MLRLEDELAGLIEAAAMPADQHGGHSSDAVSPVPGEITVAHNTPAVTM